MCADRSGLRRAQVFLSDTPALLVPVFVAIDGITAGIKAQAAQLVRIRRRVGQIDKTQNSFLLHFNSILKGIHPIFNSLL